ncbi:MAG: TetR/AcrR family transcriptional regulator [Rhodobacter sp.]|nr:TetR/AcrR family transcriptional regulator [Paracoccaceae bacterium]MCC0076557.1 TetR/AcrR family transcriptional regulator [Rhodobacter sp.]
MQTVSPRKTEGRVARRRARNHEALIASARAVMAEKGIDSATMAEIADRADVAAGTIYSFFRSKDDLAVAVLENLMLELAIRIETVTNTFDDPAQVYAYGIGSVVREATQDTHWRQLLYRSEVLANAMFKQMGPFAIRDLENATKAGRFKVADAALTFKMASYAIVGVALAVTEGEMPETVIDECVVNLLCMTGISREDALELAHRHRPPLAAV